jgi:hypothetical protein
MGYAKKLIQKPSMIEDSDFEDLRAAGWDERGVYKTTALISLFNYSGRMEAASGLPVDRIPEEARIPEATPGKPTAAQACAWEDSKGTRDSMEASLKLAGRC